MPRLPFTTDPVWLFTAPTHTRRRTGYRHHIPTAFGRQRLHPEPFLYKERAFTYWFICPHAAISHFGLNPDPYDRTTRSRLKVTIPPLSRNDFITLYVRKDPTAIRPVRRYFPRRHGRTIDDRPTHKDFEPPTVPLGALLLPLTTDDSPSAPRTAFLSNLPHLTRTAHTRLHYRSLLTLLEEKGIPCPRS